MKIKSITIKNFLTIGKAEINLEDRGLLLIQGKNDDDTSADSNGAGKSSIADAICWALYGVTARGVSTDSVVNKTAKKDCRVEVHLTDGANEYKIIRHRKDSTHKNQTFVLQRDPNPAAAPTELHKGTERETQEVVNALMGCSLEVFQAAVYAGQEKMPDLPAMTDKQLKTMIEEAAGTEILTKAYELARAKMLTTKATLDATASSLRAAASAHAMTATKLIDETTRHADFEAQRKPLAKAELAHTLPLTKSKREWEAKVALAEAVDRGTQLAAITAAFAALKAENDEAARLDKQVLADNNEYVRARSTAEIAKKVHTDAVEALRTVEDQLGKACGECGKTYCEHDLDAAKILRMKSLKDCESVLRDAVTDAKAKLAAYKASQERASTFKSTMTDVSAMAARQTVLKDELAQIEVWKKEAAAVQARIDRHVAAAKVLIDAGNPYAASETLLKKQLSDFEDEIRRVELKLKMQEMELALQDNAVKVYGPAGVRAHILDTVTPFLNARTSHYLATLADGNIKAVWNTLTANAKGEIKEKFCIEVSNDRGADSFDGLSGGEKRKVRLACCMALQDMVASRATKPIELFIADEVDHALDESGLERLMTVLNDKARERGTVLVISHNSLSDWIDNVITVTKKAGYGQVSGAC